MDRVLVEVGAPCEKGDGATVNQGILKITVVSKEPASDRVLALPLLPCFAPDNIRKGEGLPGYLAALPRTS